MNRLERFVYDFVKSDVRSLAVMQL